MGRRVAADICQETGGPTDPKGAAKWAKDHQQLGTDQYHAEASVDMADQRTVKNEQTGKWRRPRSHPMPTWSNRANRH